ncbi:cytochrome P450 [Talaromyces proteolyticus]|uniref:Cytochrome P450 n=1 Tax=Talaromyces proteolyticus TaxID=1131652 RepID=A0AAD4KQQ5_9EURO|nr:cytochrome P450 [Talaromyces proteolyticus]KAH8697234.1 cytochrome P450 [Talaromyces proteolyticus]
MILDTCRRFPWAFGIMKSLPLAILDKVASEASLLLQWQRMFRLQVDTIIASNRGGQKVSGTIFQALLDRELPPEEKSADRLQDEAQTLVGAGSETTAKLSLVVLEPSDPAKVLLSQLEQLPYLNTVINEGLRLMHGVTSRLARDWEIPPSTLISQCNYFVHMDPTIFPDPFEFNPDRWIEANKKDIRLARYMVPFTRGGRQCVGINLAYAEIFFTLFVVMRRFEFEIYETTVEDVRTARDYFVGVPEPGSKGVRVLVTKANR